MKKYFIFVSFFVLSSCASKKPVPVVKCGGYNIIQYNRYTLKKERERKNSRKKEKNYKKQETAKEFSKYTCNKLNSRSSINQTKS